MAALLLGRLLTRPDLEPALAHFLIWAADALHSEGPKAHFLVPGRFCSVVYRCGRMHGRLYTTLTAGRVAWATQIGCVKAYSYSAAVTTWLAATT